MQVFERVDLEHVPRERNVAADRLGQPRRRPVAGRTAAPSGYGCRGGAGRAAAGGQRGRSRKVRTPQGRTLARARRGRPREGATERKPPSAATRAVRVKRWGKSPPARRATVAARQPPSGARSSRKRSRAARPSFRVDRSDPVNGSPPARERRERWSPAGRTRAQDPAYRPAPPSLRALIAVAATARRSCVPRVVAGTHERPGLDVRDPHRLAVGLVRGELLGRGPAMHGQVLRVGCRYWPIVTMSTPAPRRSRRRARDLLGRLAHAEDQVGLRDLPGSMPLREAEHLERALVAERGTDPCRAAGARSRGCARTRWGPASNTVAMSGSPPLKSLGETSTSMPGTASRHARIASAQIAAPPSTGRRAPPPSARHSAAPSGRRSRRSGPVPADRAVRAWPSSRRRTRIVACTSCRG